MARGDKRKQEKNGVEAESLPQEATPQFRLRVLVNKNQTSPFDDWLAKLRDRAARARILLRFGRIERDGNFGDHRERIAGAVSELRLDYGPGYRIYYVLNGDTLVILLGGGTKDTQQKDIVAAQSFWEESKDDVEGLSREFRG